MSARLTIRDDADVATATLVAYDAARREVLRRGLTLGAATLSAATVPALLRARNAFAQADGDPAVLDAAIRLERTAVLAYDRILSGGRLRGAFAGVAQRFREHEREHLDALALALERLGGTAPFAPDQELLAPLAGLRTSGAILGFLLELEAMTVRSYHDGLGRLSDPALVRSVASIMAAEGQHLVVLRQALDRPPAPSPFETGSSRG